MATWLFRELSPVASYVVVAVIAVAIWIFIIVPLWRAFRSFRRKKLLGKQLAYAVIVLLVFAVGLWIGWHKEALSARLRPSAKASDSAWQVSQPPKHMKGVDVNLPTGVSGETWALSDYVSVSVDKDGHYFFDKNEMTEADLQARLNQVHQSDPEAQVFVRGDRDTVHGNVVHLLDMLRSAGFYEISFAIKSEALKALPAPKGTETSTVKASASICRLPLHLCQAR
jgi:biopolymer transport protein ExbD